MKEIGVGCCLPEYILEIPLVFLNALGSQIARTWCSCTVRPLCCI